MSFHLTVNFVIHVFLYRLVYDPDPQVDQVPIFLFFFDPVRTFSSFPFVYFGIRCEDWLGFVVLENRIDYLVLFLSGLYYEELVDVLVFFPFEVRGKVLGAYVLLHGRR